MFTIALIVFGFVLVGRLGLTLLPDLSYPTLTIRTEYAGAAPAEVENLLSKPIEEAVGVVKNLRQVRSVSRAGQSDVLLEFNWGTDMGMAGLDVREKLDIVQLPLDVRRPSLLRFNPSLAPIVRLSLSRNDGNKTFSEQQLIALRRLAEEEIKRRIESIEGIAAVKVSGGLEDEIQVNLDQQKLNQFNLTIDQVASRLRAENVSMSGGRLEQGTQQFLVRTINQYQSIEEIANSIITTENNKSIYLKDIATVAQKYKEREAITRLNGSEAIEIAIYKEGDANTVSVAERLTRRLNFIKKNLGGNIELTQVYNQASFIQQAINEVIGNAVVGGLLAMLILYLFLRNFRATLIISLSIPISVIISFNMMYGFGITMNVMSLGGIALAVGLLVDNAIVVLENIARKREQGLEPSEAARAGAKEVSGAIFAATMTTIAVFLPLVFVDGIAGQLFGDQALTVTFALLISLLVALTFIPMVSASNKSSDGPIAPTVEQSRQNFLVRGLSFVFVQSFSYLMGLIQIVSYAVSKFFRFILTPLVFIFEIFYSLLESSYARLLNAALKAKLLVVTIAFGLLAVSVSLIPSIGIELIPQLSQGEVIIELKSKAGTPLDSTDATVNKAQQLISEIEEIERSYSVAGTGNRLDASPEKGGENYGEINVVIKQPISADKERAVIAKLRQQLSQLAGVEVNIKRPELFSFKTPLEIEIVGYSLDKLSSVSDQLLTVMKTNDRFSDIKSTLQQGHPEVQIVFDHEKAAFLGLNVPTVANTVVKQIRGEVATKYAFRDRKIDILVRAQETDRSSVDDIRKIIVNSDQERSITLDAIADIKVAIGPSEINRVGQERVAIVSANLAYGDLGEGAAELQKIVDNMPELKGIEVRVAGQNEEMQQSFTSLKMALALAIFLVYLVMASQFESLLHPFVILFSVPLAMIGAIAALYITQTTISVVVFIGLIMLAGIVVNNAIVLIDRINQLREQGMAEYEAVVSGGKARLRPIIMTTLTTALGMLPLALGLGEGAEIRAPMAITVIGGLLVSTLLTLVVIPALYLLMDRKG
jgi:HAE1 family hydrophobic/amphiphilic exporter-1